MKSKRVTDAARVVARLAVVALFHTRELVAQAAQRAEQLFEDSQFATTRSA
jgi:hypothetical protein